MDIILLCCRNVERFIVDFVSLANPLFHKLNTRKYQNRNLSKT